jgi:putative peptide maturation system protein
MWARPLLCHRHHHWRRQRVDARSETKGSAVILVLSGDGDLHAEAVEEELARRGHRALRFDLAQFPERATVSLALGAGGELSGGLHASGTRVTWDEITAVWVRRPGTPQLRRPDLGDVARRQLEADGAAVLADLWELLDARFVPGRPDAIAHAAHRSRQLRLAAGLGFELPPTLTGNDPEAFLDLATATPGPVVTKRSSPGRRLAAEDGEGVTRNADVLAPRDLVNVPDLRWCPVTAQRYIDKAVELRITVVGDRVFPAAIGSPRASHSRVDWRRADHACTPFVPHELPDDVERLCIELVAALDLHYGCIDLVLTPDDRLVFLEIDPTGQYLWIEQLTGLPITTALADLLVGAGPMADAPALTPERLRSVPSASAATVVTAAGPAPAAVPADHPSPTTGPVELTDADRAALVDAAEALAAADASGEGALSGLRGRHGAHRFRLLSDHESYDGSTHHALLVRREDGPTLSVSVATGPGLPWPLRGVTRTRELDLLDVNGTRLAVAQALAGLEGLFHDRPVMRRLIDACLVNEALSDEPVDLSAADLQVAADAFRRAKGLRSAADTRRWLDDRGLDLEGFAELVTRQAELDQLRLRITGGDVERWWQTHRDELATVLVAWWAVAGTSNGSRPDGPSPAGRSGGDTPARRIEALGRIRAAHRRGQAGAVASHRVIDLPAGLAPVGGAPRGTPVAVTLGDGSPGEAVVLDRSEAVLDDGTRQLVAERLFDEWLAEGRRTARITWFWGDDRIAQTTVEAVAP